jgi:hypothetical protein
VTKVDGRQIEFTVRATEGGKEIGAGSHSRVVITWLSSRGGSDEQHSVRLRLAGTLPLASYAQLGQGTR